MPTFFHTKSTKLLFALFIFLHIVLLNVNAAEWGDSYRILRASEYVRSFSYPTDEKRPPLFSAVLATYPENVDPILWGRLIMFLFSVGCFFLFVQILNYVFSDPDDKADKNGQSKKNLALVLFIFNPVFLYWSLRLYADVPFTFLVLLAYYLVFAKSRVTKFWPVLVGIITGLAIMTRFEGYILFCSLVLAITLHGNASLLKVSTIKKNLGSLALFLGASALVVLPYLYKRNPFTSTYFEEPTNRTYDLNTLAIYLLSFLFLFGLITAVYFIARSNYRQISTKLGYGLLAFIGVELLLVLLWPAAVPRLFVPVIPFLLIFVADGIVQHFRSASSSKTNPRFVVLLLLGAYALGQYFYKLQFLVSMKYAFVAIVVLAVLQLFFIWLKKPIYFYTFALLGLVVWSLAPIYMHKDIHRAVKEANIYAVTNLQGKIGYNDISSVSNWYLNDSASNDSVEGVYYDLTKKENREYSALAERDLDYLLVTNEHNTDTTLDLEPWPHLQEVKEFAYEINGKVFWTRIIKFEYN